MPGKQKGCGSHRHSTTQKDIPTYQLYAAEWETASVYSVSVGLGHYLITSLNLENLSGYEYSEIGNEQVLYVREC